MKSTKRKPIPSAFYRMSLFASVERKTTGRQARVKCSHTCFAITDERQAEVLVRHPDHTVGQACKRSCRTDLWSSSPSPK
jgi:hypothetical protein